MPEDTPLDPLRAIDYAQEVLTYPEDADRLDKLATKIAVFAASVHADLATINGAPGYHTRPGFDPLRPGVQRQLVKHDTAFIASMVLEALDDTLEPQALRYLGAVVNWQVRK